MSDSETTSGAGINSWLKKKTAAGALAAATAGVGQSLEVDLDLLDPNPRQPRQEWDADALAELVESVRMYGLIQPISVTRQTSGRYIILAGERRSRAFRHLRDTATTPEEKARWAKIPASDRGPTAENQLAELALTENLLRDDLRPMETAEALADFREKRELTTEQVAKSLSLDLTKTKRLLQLAGAPPAVRQALGKGLMVETDADGEPGAKPRREHRTLELSHALLVLRAHGHWSRTKPKKAVDLTRALVEKVLVELWSHRRLKEYVDNLLEGKPSATENTASETGQGDAPAATQKSSAPFQTDDKRLVVFRSRLSEASAEDKASLKGLLSELLKQL